MEALELERLPYRLDLVDESLHLPERVVVRPVGASAPELVEENDPPAVGEPFERLHVVVGEARAAVQRQQRDPALADVAPEDAPARNVDVALGHGGDSS